MEHQDEKARNVLCIPLNILRNIYVKTPKLAQKLNVSKTVLYEKIASMELERREPRFMVKHLDKRKMISFHHYLIRISQLDEFAL